MCGHNLAGFGGHAKAASRPHKEQLAFVLRGVKVGGQVSKCAAIEASFQQTILLYSPSEANMKNAILSGRC